HAPRPGTQRRWPRGAGRYRRGHRAFHDRALLARDAPRIERARRARTVPRLLRRLARDLSSRHALRGAQDPGHGDHRGARAGPPRGLRRRGGVLRVLRWHGYRHRHPLGADARRARLHPGGSGHRRRLGSGSRAPRMRQQGPIGGSGGAHGGATLIARLPMIDNYDSFTYNLVQYLRELRAEGEVRRNDAVGLDQVAELAPGGRVVAPGPCTPREAGVSVPLIQRFAGRIPILGVCLGHQAIGAAFGGEIVRAPRIMHGKTSPIRHDGAGVFAGLPDPFDATRYHSLVIDPATLPATLVRSAWTDQGEIMGVRHRTAFVEGVQFHPESILTLEGKRLWASSWARRRGAAAGA